MIVVFGVVVSVVDVLSVLVLVKLVVEDDDLVSVKLAVTIFVVVELSVLVLVVVAVVVLVVTVVDVVTVLVTVSVDVVVKVLGVELDDVSPGTGKRDRFTDNSQKIPNLWMSSESCHMPSSI
jgi:hypothetical protein